MYYQFVCVNQSQVMKSMSYEDHGARLTCLAQDSGCWAQQVLLQVISRSQTPHATKMIITFHHVIQFHLSGIFSVSTHISFPFSVLVKPVTFGKFVHFWPPWPVIWIAKWWQVCFCWASVWEAPLVGIPASSLLALKGRVSMYIYNIYIWNKHLCGYKSCVLLSFDKSWTTYNI